MRGVLEAVSELIRAEEWNYSLQRATTQQAPSVGLLPDIAGAVQAEPELEPPEASVTSAASEPGHSQSELHQ